MSKNVQWVVLQDSHSHQLEVKGRFRSNGDKIIEMRRQIPFLDILSGSDRTNAAIKRAQDEMTAEFEFTQKYGWLKSL